MPRFDGTGPFGTGPVGRGLGPCRQNRQNNVQNDEEKQNKTNWEIQER